MKRKGRRARKELIRIVSLLLSVLLSAVTPLGDYIWVRTTMPVYGMSGLSVIDYIWSLVMSSCGVNVPNDDIGTISSEISTWIKASHPSTSDMVKSLLLLESYAQDQVWGIVFDGFGDIVEGAKEYLGSKEGYGTDAGIDGITVTVCGSDYSKSFSAKYGGGYAESYFGRENYLCSSEYTSRSINGPTSGKHLQSDYFLTDGYDRSVRYCFFKGNGSYILYKYGSGGFTYGGNVLGVISYYNDGSFAERTTASSVDMRYDYVDTYLPLLPLPVYDTDSAMRAYLANGILGNPLNGITSDGLTHALLVPVVSRPFVQKRAITKVGPLTLPADYSSAVAHQEQVSSAVTPEDMAAALAPVVEVVYESDAAAGEEDKTYPWIPDITSPLGAIKDVLLAAGKTLTEIKDGILAIPGQITDFFTVDTAQVAVAQAAVSEAFEAKFSALYALSDVFNFKEDFTDVIPVITIAVPDFLQFAFPGQDRIVILDLRPYKNLFDSARTLIAAALWVLFARWVLEQFDVKFGVN